MMEERPQPADSSAVKIFTAYTLYRLRLVVEMSASYVLELEDIVVVVMAFLFCLYLASK